MDATQDMERGGWRWKEGGGWEIGRIKGDMEWTDHHFEQKIEPFLGFVADEDTHWLQGAYNRSVSMDAAK